MSPLSPRQNYTDRLEHYVIGSGPSGVACASALVRRGGRVRIADAGISIEPARADLVADLRRSPPGSWTDSQVFQLKAGMRASAQGIPLKLAYGSDFPYRDCDRHLRVSYHGVSVRPSLARGGLSNTWGAAMMPYREPDIADWPIGLSELAPHYVAAAELTGLSGKSDDLEHLFPLYRRQPAALNLSRQATLLLTALGRHRTELTRAGIHFGQARVAVQAALPQQSNGCVYCGLCMYGCPYGFIYNAETTLQQLRMNPNVSYEPDIVITTLQESSDSVRIEGYHRLDSSPYYVEAERVYLACGAIPTTQILLRSLAVYDQDVWMKDNQYFLLPLVLATAAGDVAHESLHTLSQVFLEILDTSISPYTVHLQLYSYNDLIGQAVRQSLGPAAGLFGFLVRSLESRLLIIQGYLHSAHSARIGVRLKKGPPDSLELKADTNRDTAPIVRRVVRKLFRVARYLGAFPLSPMLQIAEPGRGFHTGGTFPMRSHPGTLESDTLGRPLGFRRVHVVDATVLPSIPATTITFSVMANAHRIGWESMDLS
jgi:choline dehydrogenase-like flavoprotein